MGWTGHVAIELHIGLDMGLGLTIWIAYEDGQGFGAKHATRAEDGCVWALSQKCGMAWETPASPYWSCMKKLRKRAYGSISLAKYILLFFIL